MSAPIIPTSGALNYVVVNGVQSPGRAMLTGVATPYKYDIQPSYGKDGAVTIYKGRDVAKFTLTIWLWRPEHFVLWAVFAKLLEPPKVWKPLVVDMAHPLLSAADIKSVAVERFGQPERQTNGVWQSVSQLLEYRPLQLALVKPRGSIPSPDKGAPIAPKTEADKALVSTMAQFQAVKN